MCSLPVLLLHDSAVRVENSKVDGNPATTVDALAWAGWSVGFVTQCVADWQKFKFRGDANNRNKFITHGLWGVSQHPNYFAEMVTLCFSKTIIKFLFHNF